LRTAIPVLLYFTLLQPGPFNWDTKTQGLVLGAFFYGYMTTQVLGGTLAQMIGGKVLMLFGVAWTAALTLLLPVLTDVGGLAAIFVLRFLMGMGEVCYARTSVTVVAQRLCVFVLGICLFSR